LEVVMRQGTPDQPRSAVAIMAKAARQGQVKTRLCPPLSPPQAAELYRCFLLDKIAQVSALAEAMPVVSYSPADAKAWFEPLTPAHFILVPQLGDDLGARLLSTFEHLFRLGYTRVLAIDSDTPTLPITFLTRALAQLARPTTDVVLGPTEDGGYYLIGLRQPYPQLFEQMPWSTAHVLPETVRRSAAEGLQVSCVDAWFDIDTPEDLSRLIASLENLDHSQARHTRRYLQEQRR
jgi:rSAM/selenodomain-associated transferase 1